MTTAGTLPSRRVMPHGLRRCSFHRPVQYYDPLGLPLRTTRLRQDHLLPIDNVGAGLPLAEKIVSNHVNSLTIEGGAIHLTFGNQAIAAINGKTLTLRPTIVEDAPVVPVAWVCGHAWPPDQMTLQGTNRTDVDKNLLPLNCRAG